MRCKPPLGILLTLAVALLLAAPIQADPERPSPDLRASFLDPASDTRPGCYWYWINDNISKEGITKDLEAMARVGIGRAYIGHIFGQGERWETPVGDVPFMSDAWWEAVQWAVKEADRCGVEIGFFNSPGWSQSGAPWVKPSQSMRYLTASETVIDGGRRVETLLPIPEIKTYPNAGGLEQMRTGDNFTEDDFQDVRVIAFRQPDTETADIDMAEVMASSPTLKPLEPLFDGSKKTSLKIGPQPQEINFTLDGTRPVQSLRIDPLDHLYTLTCVVSTSDDGGKTFRELTRHAEQRGHQGPRNKDPILVPFPETRAKHIRITLSATKPLSISGIALSRRAVLAYHVRRQLGETDPSVWPLWNAYVWDGQPAPAAGSAVDSSSVLDLSDMMDATGRLTWPAPPGRWVVMRAGMAPLGTQNAPASPESRGLEVDKMNRDHIRSLFDGMVGEFLRRTPPEDRKALKYVIADSYETGPQNWTDGLLDKFESRFGYSAVPFLPCLDGRVVDTPEVSARFLWDWRRLVAESIARDYVGGLREVSNEHGLSLWLENYGHWGFPSEFLLYGAMTDQIGGEFWENYCPSVNIECRAASSAANIYGRNDVYAEAFTSNRNFIQSPGGFKSWGDWVYGTGINHFILHVNIHQPDERKPGIIAWFGTAFNRHNTWFGKSKAFIDYNRRCSVLLKAGTPVIDVAYYIGENAPAMQGPRDPALPDGYDFDYINSDVLIHRAKVVDGRITVPNGPSYAVLVLPQQTVMRPEVAKAIRHLIHDGATVVGPMPHTSPSLAGYPESDAAVQAIAAEVWGDVDGQNIRQRKFGAGTIHDGVTLEQVFAGIGLPPDVQVESAENLVCAVAGNGTMGVNENGGIIFWEIYYTDPALQFERSLSHHATSTDFENWELKGPILDFGEPGTPDSAAACAPWLIQDDAGLWHMFYLGTQIVSPAPALVPSPPYLTLRASAPSPAGPWTKHYTPRPFTTTPGTYYAKTASPGHVLKHENEYLQFFSASATEGVFKRTLGIARTKNLEGAWTVDPTPIVPLDEQIENSSIYYEPANSTWFLFTNHISIENGAEFTDAIWVYWTWDPNQWDPAHKAVVLDGSNCNWSNKCIGMPSVTVVGDKLHIFYDAPDGDSTSHMHRSLGRATLQLPLDPTIP